MTTLEEALYPTDIDITLARRNYGDRVLPGARVGVMWHYDGSRTDKGAQNWFDDPAFKLSYNRAYTDSGRRIRLTPDITWAAYHAGKCRKDTRVTIGANTHFYGLCVTATSGQEVTYPQFEAIIYDTALIARWHQRAGHVGWETHNISYWLTGHQEWAIFDNGQLGRKTDPHGTDPTKHVLSLNSGRPAVAALLSDPTRPLWQGRY